MIRAATAADLTAVIAIERALATAPHWAEQIYAEIIAGRNGCCLLVDEDASGRLTGFAVSAVIAGEGELESIAVAADAQRKGIGRVLGQAVVGWCRAQQATLIRLEVRAASEGVIRLYEQLGFKAAGRRPAYYADPVDDAVLMEWRLDAADECTR